MSGLFGSTTIKGNRITDFAEQTGTVGVPIPFGYGVPEPIDGNIIWAGPVSTTVSRRRQGKGGVKTEEYTYRRSYAIAFIQGPIYGYLTIFRNGKVVYTTDPRTTVEDREYAELWLENATLYLGTRDQMPDSTIEQRVGVGQVSAHRGLAYIVLEEENVTDNSGAVPTYQALVIATPPQVFMTSRPYAVESMDLMTSEAQPLKGSLFTNPPTEDMDSEAQVLGGDIYGSGVVYDDGLPESIEAEATVEGGIIFGSGVVYDDALPESIESEAIVTGGDIAGESVEYNEWPEEDMTSGATVTGGDLT